MKHRTVTVFIVVLAAMASVPKSLEQFAALKESAGNRLNAGIWNAFLSLHGQKIGSPTRMQEPLQSAGFELAAQTDAPQQKVRQEKETAEPSKIGHKPSSRRAYDFEASIPAFETREVELAKLEGFTHSSNVDADPKGRIVMRVPAAPDAKTVESFLSEGAIHFEAQAIAREYLLAADLVRQLEQRKVRKVAPKAAAAVQAGEKATKVGSRLLHESFFRFDNSQNAGGSDAKAASRECESTNE